MWKGLQEQCWKKSNWQMKKITISEYTGAYKSQVAELIVGIQQNEFHIPITIEQQPDLNDITGFYQQAKGNFWLALADDRVIGTIALLDIGNEQGALRKMFVEAEYRGKQYGTGQMLLDSLFAHAQEKGLREILLGTTEKFIAAHRFYEKNNFTAISKNDLPKVFPVMQVDTKFYKKELLQNAIENQT